jgi:hypothetical protein
MNQADPMTEARELAQELYVTAMRVADAKTKLPDEVDTQGYGADPAVNDYEAAQWDACQAIMRLAKELDLLFLLGDLIEEEARESLGRLASALERPEVAERFAKLRSDLEDNAAGVEER